MMDEVLPDCHCTMIVLFFGCKCPIELDEHSMVELAQSRQGGETCFGEMRSLLHQKPDADSWSALLTLMERWHADDPHSFEDRAVPYAAQHASRWPDRERVVPQRWLRQLRTQKSYEPWWGQMGRAIKLHDLPNREFVKGVIRSVAHSPMMQTMTVLELPGGYMRNFAVWTLSRSPYLSNVRELDLSYNGLSNWGINAMLRASHTQNLRRLLLNGNGLGVRESAAIASGLDWTQLEELELSHNRLDEAALVALSRGSIASNLKKFELERNMCGDEGAKALGRSPLVGQLAELNMARNQIAAQGARALTSLTSTLEVLDLSGNPLGLEGVQQLQGAGGMSRLKALRLGDVGVMLDARQPFLDGEWRRLESLNLSGNRLGEWGVEALSRLALPSLQECDLGGASIDVRAAAHFSLDVRPDTMRKLHLSFNPIGSNGAMHCMRAAAQMGVRELRLDHCQIDACWRVQGVDFSGLEWLDLRSNPLGDEGIRELVTCRWLKDVKYLDLRRCEISDEGAQLLAGCEHLSALEVLDLGENHIGKRGALALMQGRLERLHSLHLNQCPLGDRAIQAIAAVTPHHALKLLDLSWARELTSQGVAVLRSARRFSACQIIARHAPQHATPTSLFEHPSFGV